MQNKSKLPFHDTLSHSQDRPHPPAVPAARRPGLPPALLPAFIRAQSPLQLALATRGFRQSRSPLDD